MKVIGIIRKSGEYNGHAYDNYTLHCTTEDENAIGEITETVKVKAVNFYQVFGETPSERFFSSLIGVEIMPYYDKFKNLVSVNISGYRNNKKETLPFEKSSFKETSPLYGGSDGVDFNADDDGD
jgi:hypothetical protein